MKSEIFTLCDNANEYDGKLVIVGAFNRLKSKDYPKTYSNITTVSRVVVENKEKGKHEVSISIRKEGEDINLIGPFVGYVDNSSMDSEKGNINIILNMSNIEIPSKGTYLVLLKIGDFEQIAEFIAE